MRSRSLFANTFSVACAAVVLSAGAASAQAWHYPTLQVPTISSRDFQVLVAGGGNYGTSFVGQWREGIAPDVMLNFDVGLATPGSSTLFLAGAGLGYTLMKSTQEVPIDLMLTGGLYGAFGSGSLIRIPVGVVAGHYFPLSGGLAVTPFVSPRLSVDVCASDCGGEGTDLKLNFDIGARLDVTKTVGVTAALTVGGLGNSPSRTSFGIGLVYRPNMVARH
ncbi:MAG: hypothetical protein H0U66_15085 [Gemmatimonadaceae bacterium]|nr:hypothetical protein [Gemmatimonadaceae bacterium]